MLGQRLPNMHMLGQRLYNMLGQRLYMLGQRFLDEQSADGFASPTNVGPTKAQRWPNLIPLAFWDATPAVREIRPPIPPPVTKKKDPPPQFPI